VNALVAANKPVSYCNVASSCGHDAFLLDDDLDRYGRLIQAALANAAGHPVSLSSPRGGDLNCPASMFAQRLDYDHILSHIPPEATVLDLVAARAVCWSGSPPGATLC
jgi:homoserine O-acetyltransferase/O-succinyltransferase